MIDRIVLRQNYGLKASRYDKIAIPEQRAGLFLLSMIEEKNLPFKHCLDIGTGPGELAMMLGKSRPLSHIQGCDIALGMVQYAKRKRESRGIQNLSLCCGDAEDLPYPSGVFDLVISNLVYHWVADIDKAIEETGRVLRKKGLFFFSTLGPSTLKELRESMRMAFKDLGREDGNLNSFFSRELTQWEELLKKKGFLILEKRRKIDIYTYPSPFELLRFLKEIGAKNNPSHISKSFGKKEIMDRWRRYYEQYYSNHNGIQATYEIYLFVALKECL